MDFRLSARRDVAAAKAFFRKASKVRDRPADNHIGRVCGIASRRARDAADGQLAADTKLRSSKYLNNLIEQDHRGVKLRIGPMLGFKRFRTAAITIAGIELLRRIQRNSSTSTGCASRIEVRPPSGMRCWRRGKTDIIVGRHRLQLKLHQSRHGLPTGKTGGSAQSCRRRTPRSWRARG